MPRKYNKIACAIGRGIDERLERIGSEPLPQKLVDLLNRLTERGDPTSSDEDGDYAAQDRSPKATGKAS